VRCLKTVRPNVILFVDEPYMASFDSAFISLSREQVIAMLNEVFHAIQDEGALAGVHCCANTDWSVLLETGADILNRDAYGHIENLALYPLGLRQLLDRGGVVAWGILPNDEHIFDETPQSLAERLQGGFKAIAGMARRRNLLRGDSLPAARVKLMNYPTIRLSAYSTIKDLPHAPKSQNPGSR